ncbi:hypothetical protein BST61_g9893 [Cercospora zeina]
MSVWDEPISRATSSQIDYDEGCPQIADSHDDALADPMPEPEYQSVESPSHLLQDEETTRNSVPYQLQTEAEQAEQFIVSCPYPTPLPSQASSPAEQHCPSIKPKQKSSWFRSTPNGFNILGDSGADLLPAQQMSQNLFVGIMQLTPQKSQLEVISSSAESLAPSTPVRGQNSTERGTFDMETPVDYERSAAWDFGREMLKDLDELLAAGPIVDPAYDSIIPKSPSNPHSPTSPSLRQHAVASRRNKLYEEDCLAANERTLDDELVDIAEKAEVRPSEMRPPSRDAPAIETATGVEHPENTSLPNRPRPLRSPETRQGHRNIPKAKDRKRAYGAAAASATKVEVTVLGEPSPYEVPTPTQFETDLQTGAAKVIMLLSDHPAPCHLACIRTKPVLQEVRSRTRRTKKKKQKRTRDVRWPPGGTGFVEEVLSTQDQASLEKTNQRCGKKGKSGFSRSSTTDGQPAPVIPQEANEQVHADASMPVTAARSAAREDVEMQDVGTKVEVKQDEMLAAAAVKMAVPTSYQAHNMEMQPPVVSEPLVVDEAAGEHAQIAAVLITSMPAPSFNDSDGKDIEITGSLGKKQ